METTTETKTVTTTNGEETNTTTTTVTKTKRKPNDYANGSIYKLYHREKPEDIYVGSTTLTNAERLKNHLNMAKYTPTMTSKIYEYIRATNDYDGWELETLEKYPCRSDQELREQEEKWRVKLSSTLNTMRCYVSAEERRENKREYIKQYHIINAEELKVKSRERYAQLQPEVKEKRVLDKREQRKQNVAEKKFHCSACNYSAGEQSILNVHNKTKNHLWQVDHPDEEPRLSKLQIKIAQNKENKTHHCEVCDYSFGTKESLKKHSESNRHKTNVKAKEEALANQPQPEPGETSQTE